MRRSRRPCQPAVAPSQVVEGSRRPVEASATKKAPDSRARTSAEGRRRPAPHSEALGRATSDRGAPLATLHHVPPSNSMGRPAPACSGTTTCALGTRAEASGGVKESSRAMPQRTPRTIPQRRPCVERLLTKETSAPRRPLITVWQLRRPPPRVVEGFASPARDPLRGVGKRRAAADDAVVQRSLSKSLDCAHLESAIAAPPPPAAV